MSHTYVCMYVYHLYVIYPSTVVTKLTTAELPRANIALHQGAKFPSPSPEASVWLPLPVSASVSVSLDT